MKSFKSTIMSPDDIGTNVMTMCFQKGRAMPVKPRSKSIFKKMFTINKMLTNMKSFGIVWNNSVHASPSPSVMPSKLSGQARFNSKLSICHEHDQEMYDGVSVSK